MDWVCGSLNNTIDFLVKTDAPVYHHWPAFGVKKFLTKGA
jgi:hypothetical protein